MVVNDLQVINKRETVLLSHSYIQMCIFCLFIPSPPPQNTHTALNGIRIALARKNNKVKVWGRLFPILLFAWFFNFLCVIVEQLDYAPKDIIDMDQVFCNLLHKRAGYKQCYEMFRRSLFPVIKGQVARNFLL